LNLAMSLNMMTSRVSYKCNYYPIFSNIQ
jgi:hypothetical protein